jgi:hypothetical protein
VGSSDADVVQSAVVAEAEFAAGVDDIVADVWLGFSVGGAGRDRFGSGLVGGGLGCAGSVSGAAWSCCSRQ